MCPHLKIHITLDAQRREIKANVIINLFLTETPSGSKDLGSSCSPDRYRMTLHPEGNRRGEAAFIICGFAFQFQLPVVNHVLKLLDGKFQAQTFQIMCYAE